jgi:hypothetical protein
MIDAHPQIAIPPETGFLPLCAQLTGSGDRLRQDFFQLVTTYPPEASGWQDFQISANDFWEQLTLIEPFTVAAGLRTFYSTYAARFGKSRWGDKTPSYCFWIEAIASLLPEAHFIHIIRDGRDVALSWREMWFAPDQRIEALANHWVNWVTAGRQQGQQCQHYLEVRYEELIQNSPDVLTQICEFLEIEFDERMLQYYLHTPKRLEEHQGRSRTDGSVIVSRSQRLAQQHRTTQPPDPSRVFAWKTTMLHEERQQFEAIAHSTLRELGYEVM